MRGVYETNIEASGITVAKTLLILQAPPNQCLELYHSSVTNMNNETNEQLNCVWQKITTLGVPLGTNALQSPTETGDQASTAIASGNLTANEPTYGTTQYGKQGYPSLGGWFYDPIPEKRFILKPSEAAGIRLLQAPATSVDLTVSTTHRAIG